MAIHLSQYVYPLSPPIPPSHPSQPGGRARAEKTEPRAKSWSPGAGPEPMSQNCQPRSLGSCGKSH